MVPTLAEFLLPGLPFTALSLLDIAGVAILVYQLLLIVRGTRAAHVLLGIGVMVLVYGLSDRLGLEALHSILSYIVPYTAIALIILFQGEIRQTLAKIGRKRIFGRGFRRPASTDEILLAMTALSANKTGALIVLEKDIGLRTFVESGVRLDAEISRDLLLSIFRHGGELHDGAVIIEKDRISAAACFLPLSTNPALANQMGTRHRAGLGITEETDSLALIVSEETGAISVATNGALHSGLSMDDVDEQINRHFGVERRRPKAGAVRTEAVEEEREKVLRP